MKRTSPKTFICNRCKIDFISFGTRAKYCPECRKLKWKLWKKTKKWELSEIGIGYMKKYARTYSQGFKDKVFNAYGYQCKCCGELLTSMLSIDHVNNDGYKDRKLSITGPSLYKKIIKLNYPSDYQILCMNCNFSKRINKGICEHKIK